MVDPKAFLRKSGDEKAAIAPSDQNCVSLHDLTRGSYFFQWLIGAQCYQIASVPCLTFLTRHGYAPSAASQRQTDGEIRDIIIDSHQKY